MRILKRMLDFIASRMLMVTVACALLIISFYLAMNTANIWVLIDDGLDARASVVLMGEEHSRERETPPTAISAAARRAAAKTRAAR